MRRTTVAITLLSIGFGWPVEGLGKGPRRKATDSPPEVSVAAAAALFEEEPEPAPVPDGRKASELTPETVSRWSNQGAVEPIESPVTLQAPLPDRNLPRAPGIATPGQRLRGDEELLSARLSLSGYRLSTVGQGVLFPNQLDPVTGELVQREGGREIELLRGRATLAYERIAGSHFSTHLDVEYRPRLNGDGRFDDQRLNALYLAWGLTEVRRRGGPNLGFAAGRLAIREAGFAQADGVSVRWRPFDGLHIGAFGGVTGNPYGYNWALRAPETFSADWITGGFFGRWRGGPVQASLAGVVTVRNVPGPNPDEGPLDRVYAHADLAWQPDRDLSVFATGFVDLLPGGTLMQNAEISGAWTPGLWNVRLGVGRFSTLSYGLTNGVTYIDDPLRNRIELNGPPIADLDGNPIVPFDAVQLTAVYNQVRASAGYRITPKIETFVRANALIRDVSLAQEQTQQRLGLDAPAPTVEFAPLRLLPSVGARFRDPDLIDVEAQAVGVIDEQSQADAILQLGLGRSLFGLHLRGDVRYLFGAIGAFDGGLSLAYQFPRDWMPGQLQLRGAFRYFREDLILLRPVDLEQRGVIDEDQLEALPFQESYLGFAGVEWRI